MIKSFEHKGLRRFFETGNASGIDPAHRQKVRMRLAALDTASSIDDMDLPGFRLHPLRGDKQGLWAIDVSKTGASRSSSAMGTPTLLAMRIITDEHV